MPNAPREYRSGVHEGVDWYDGASCVPVTGGQPVLAMHDGVVVRADLDYRELTLDVLADLQERTVRCSCSEPVVLDVYRGRQVWIDHGSGVVTRYAHLESIADGIRPGVPVERGRVVGGVGESGTLESLTAPGSELHPHAEVRVGESFLGAGLPPDEVRARYRRLFEPAPGDG